MKKFLSVVCATLVSAPALAVSVIATPALRPPSGGSVFCYLSNSSATKDIQVKWSIYDYQGSEQFSATSTLKPLQNTRSGNAVTAQSTCVVTVLKGSKSNLRVSLAAHDSSGNMLAAVQGQ